MVVVSFVIVTYFSDALISGCIEAIRRFAKGEEGSYEIIIVDQSTDEGYNKLIEVMNADINSDISILRNKANGGYGQGNNIGIKSAHGTIIVVVNPDVLLPDSGFHHLLHAFRKDDNLALAGGKQFGGINLSFWVRPEFNFPLFTTPISLICNKMNLYFEKYMFLSGAMLIIDKQKFLKAGLFDENIFLYFEESDITKRILSKGFKTKFLKKIQYIHLINETKTTTDRQFETEFKSAQYYFQKYGKNFQQFLDRKIYSYKVQLSLQSIFYRRKSYKNTYANLCRVKRLKSNDSY